MNETEIIRSVFNELFALDDETLRKNFDVHEPGDIAEALEELKKVLK
jgi:hypothetical protein